MKSRLLIMLMAAATLLSCTTTKDNNLAYFKDLAATTNGTLPNVQGNYPIRIQPDDELVITVTSSRHAQQPEDNNTTPHPDLYRR